MSELPKLPNIEELGITRVSEGPPLPARLDIKWPEPVRNYLRKTWPGTPFPRSWGEAAAKRLPGGMGKGVQGIVDSLGL